MATTDTTLSQTSAADLAGYFASCSDAFGQLAAIVRVIRLESEREAHCATSIANLAGAAEHIANDLEGLSDDWRSEVLTRGVRNQ